MTQSPNPFAHHPELRDIISDPLQSFFRTFRIENMVDMLVENGLPTGWWHSEEFREASRAQTLKHLGDDDLWIVGYGSLMWDPAFIFSDVRKCYIPGFTRQFILKEEYGGRGDPNRPGLFAALDSGDGCDGLAFKIANSIVDAETEILWRREMVAPGYVPTFVDVILGEENIRALTFVADHEADLIDPSLSREQQVEMIATASGILGTNLEYLQNIADHFEILDIHDPHITGLLQDTQAFIRANQTDTA